MNKLKLILQHFPTVLVGVMAVEEAMPTAPGAAKKEVLLAGISAAAKAAGLDPNPHVQAGGALADDIVSALNKTGWFTRKPQAVGVAK